jgi:beta-glucanase (GH16 family)
MKRFHSAICTLVLLSGIASATEWKLVWSAEFDYEGMPDPAKWDYEVGFVRNRESQHYTRARKENARGENGMLVIDERIDFFFDKTKYHTFPLKKADQGAFNPFRLPQYLIVNLAIEGSWGGPVDDTVLPQKYLIDYVRIYQAKSPASRPAH